jgi:hypothetical protein
MLAMLPVAVAAEKMETMAYVVDRAGFAELRSEWRWDASPPRDLAWFKDGGVDPDPNEAFVAPVRLEKKPNGSRFFGDGDTMWLLTGTLRQQKILTDERSWAVWNADRSRLVVHGTAREQGTVAVLWQDLQGVMLVATSVELVKVRCRELAAVAWTEEEVRKRGGQVVHAIGLTTRPGQRGDMVMGTEAGEVHLEAEANTNRTGEVVDLRFNCEAAVRHAGGVRTLTVNTSMTIYPGRTIYFEVGGADEPGETYLLGVRSHATCMNGMPRWQWREFEDESIQQKPPEKMPEYFEWTTLPDGVILCRVLVPPTFLSDLSNNNEGDPFAPDDAGPADRVNLRKQVGAMGLSVVESLADVPQCLATDLVFDLTGFMKKQVGLAAPKGGWIYYNYTRCVLVAKLDEETTDLLKALTAVLDGGPSRMVLGTVIEWEGELEPGSTPAGARRLARMGILGRPGQRATTRHGWPMEELKRGGVLTLEPNVGANNRIVDVRVDFIVAGSHAMRLATGLTVANGQPVVVPLGEVGGKKQGVVLECRIIDARGRRVPR